MSGSTPILRSTGSSRAAMRRAPDWSASSGSIGYDDVEALPCQPRQCAAGLEYLLGPHDGVPEQFACIGRSPDGVVGTAKIDCRCEGIPVVSAQNFTHRLVGLLVHLHGQPHSSCLVIGGCERGDRPQCVRVVAAQAALLVSNDLLVLREGFPGAARTEVSLGQQLPRAH